MRINLYDMLMCLSNAVDLVTPEVSNHHQQVAYLAFRLAEQNEAIQRRTAGYPYRRNAA